MHDHHHHHEAASPAMITVCLVINLVFVAVEALIGWRSGSTGLVSDAGHNLSDALGMLLSLISLLLIQHGSRRSDFSRNSISDYLIYMERAGMIAQLRDSTGGIRGIGKVEKFYLDNTNLIYTLTPREVEIGNVRETFFMNQLRVRHDIVSSSISDFQIEDKTFEIGGRKKGQKQNESAANGYIVKDDIETGFANVIPLWAFGLNY